MPEKVTVGGAYPGEVEWLDDYVARVWCDGHARPESTYEAACYDGADLDDVVSVPAREAGYWYVGPRLLVEGLEDLE